MAWVWELEGNETQETAAWIFLDNPPTSGGSLTSEMLQSLFQQNTARTLPGTLQGLLLITNSVYKFYRQNFYALCIQGGKRRGLRIASLLYRSWFSASKRWIVPFKLEVRICLRWRTLVILCPWSQVWINWSKRSIYIVLICCDEEREESKADSNLPVNINSNPDLRSQLWVVRSWIQDELPQQCGWTQTEK